MSVLVSEPYIQVKRNTSFAGEERRAIGYWFGQVKGTGDVSGGGVLLELAPNTQTCKGNVFSIDGATAFSDSLTPKERTWRLITDWPPQRSGIDTAVPQIQWSTSSLSSTNDLLDEACILRDILRIPFVPLSNPEMSAGSLNTWSLGCEAINENGVIYVMTVWGRIWRQDVHRLGGPLDWP